MDDDFFDNAQTAGTYSAVEQPQQVYQEAGGHIDDFFGGGNDSHQQQQDTFHQEQHVDDFFGAAQTQSNVVQSSYQGYGEASNVFDNASTAYGGFSTVEQVSHQPSEQDLRRQRLQKEDQERTERIISKQNEEYALKSSKISNAKAYLQNWKSEKDQTTSKRKQIAIQEEEVAIESRSKVTYKNPWEKITDNINLKASEHPGEKDVTRIRESILNKKIDMQNIKN